MKGLVIWPYSECRSTMATYQSLSDKIGASAYFAILRDNKTCGMALRAKTGFRTDEFAGVDKTYVGLDFNIGLEIINTHPGWDHLFGEFQDSAVTRRLIYEAKKRGSRIIVACESPCNMFYGVKRVAKEAYMRLVLPFLSRKVVQCADAYVNYSGADDAARKFCRWPANKIFPFGYFPPPIEGSKSVERKSNSNFFILSTGILTKHRGADILLKALKLLHDWGVEYSAVITQEGELLGDLRRYAKKYSLPVNFPGRVPISELIKMYETCSVFVGAGRSEPWGMRLNDALNCGAPLIISAGMGGKKLVEDNECGLICKANDPQDMAMKIKLLATDSTIYNRVAHNAFRAAENISPERKSCEIVALMRDVGWMS